MYCTRYLLLLVIIVVSFIYFIYLFIIFERRRMQHFFNHIYLYFIVKYMCICVTDLTRCVGRMHFSVLSYGSLRIHSARASICMYAWVCLCAPCLGDPTLMDVSLVYRQIIIIYNCNNYNDNYYYSNCFEIGRNLM